MNRSRWRLSNLCRSSDLLSLLLAQHLGRGLGSYPRAHNGILAAHAPSQGTFQLGTKGQLLQVDTFFLVQFDTLLAQSFGVVIEAINGLPDILDLGDGAVAGAA